MGAGHREVFLHGHSCKQSAAFRYQRNAGTQTRISGNCGNIGAIKPNSAGRGLVGAGDRAQQRGLSGPVGSDQRQGFARGDFEG